MNSRPSLLRRSRVPLAAALVLGAVGAVSQFAPSLHSQAAAPLDPRLLTVLNPLVDQLKAQQDTMVANQAKIEAQTAALREELRLMKIFSARSGGSLRH